MIKFSFEEMIKARVARDASYDGQFFVGVRTMKIYCLPSCKAKLALEKNTEFFSTREEAEEAGYRSCKRCKPELFPKITPLWMDGVLHYMQANFSQKINEKILVLIAGVDISTLNRHFKIHYQLTPLTYHRKLRLAYAMKLIHKGINYKDIPTRCGFKSNSGFRAAFTKEFGYPPGEVKHV
ncbi:MAG: bifunctional transcriptional activator/DNA repair enzyme AdaA [Candidatus Hodarchaeales archaeon]|jgi:methylphosphotriester-DNA--protein-cysteine methyltransferase